MITLEIGNDNVIELHDLTNTVTDVEDTTATVTVTLQDGTGAEVSGQTWPATMAYASGVYRATLEPDLVLRAGGYYKAIVNVAGSGGETAKWELQVTAKPRKVY